MLSTARSLGKERAYLLIKLFATTGVTVQELHKRGVPYREIAVLYRAHYVTRALEEALIEASCRTPSTAVCSFSTGWRSRTHCPTCA